MTTTVNRPEADSESPDMLSRALARVYTLNWEAITYVVIFALAVFSRLFMLGDRAMSHDESLHTRYSYNLATDFNFQHTPLMHGPILFHFTALFYFLFGANDFTSRLYAALLGIVVVMMPLLFRRWLGRWGAILASIMLLISPITLYYNRYIRHDTPNIFFTLLMIYGMFMYLSGPAQQRRKEHWLYLIAGAMLMNLGSKETAFIYIAIIGIYLAIYWFMRLAQDFFDALGKTAFYTLIMAFSVGGIAALGMFVTLSINLQEQPFFEAITTLTSYSTFITWTIAVIASVGIGVMVTVLNGFRGTSARLSAGEGVRFFGLSVIISTILIILEELSRLSHETGGVEAQPTPDGSSEVVANAVNFVPIGAIWVLGIIVLALVFITWGRGWWRIARERYPEFDLLVLIGTLILPWATPFIIQAAGIGMTVQSINAYTRTEIIASIAALIPMFAMSITIGLLWNWRKWTISLVIFYALFAFFFTTMFSNPNGIATGLIGSLGYWLEQQGVRRGNQPQYYYLMIIMPMYEYLVVFGSTFAAFGGLSWFWRFRANRLAERQREENEATISDLLNEPDAADIDDEYEPLPEPEKPKLASGAANVERLDRLPFLPFVAWWAILNLIGYTLAGEKMPWLAIHLSLPMILLTGWFFGRIFERIDLSQVRKGGWLALVLMPLLFVLTGRLIAPFLFGDIPLAGLDAASLRQSGQWIAVLAIAGMVAVGVWQLADRVGWRHIRQMTAVAFFAFFGVLTLRAAWMASFINYDLANEYLVYAHAAPAVKTVLNDIEELSRRTTDGLDLQFVYDNEVSWPYSWYFRDFNNAVFVGSSPNAQQLDNAVAAVVGEANRAKFEPLLEDRFYRYEYIRLWWPMQDYFNMTPARLANTWDFRPVNEQAANIRRGLWDIWWARDYSTYGDALNRNFELTRWPVSDRMHFYVRKDVAAQVWNLGAGEGVVSNPLTADGFATNTCTANWQPLTAEVDFSNQSGLRLNHPVGLAVAGNSVFVAEEFGHRLVEYTRDGEFLGTLGQAGRVFDANGGFLGHEGTLGLFERPNSIATAPDGNLYVADTWNFRVQNFSPEGTFLRAWGSRGEFGESAQIEPTDGFWGPRDVAVDSDGLVYVADTGNKRVRVYTPEGDWVRDIGSAGSGDGQLNEPAGLAIVDDRLYVADTWNRRVSVFDLLGTPLFNFRVRAWYNDQGNRPYLAIDDDNDLLYVTDPDAARVLVYNLEGDCLGSFGQPAANVEAVGPGEFVTAGGVAVDDDGSVYVVDVGAGRVVRYGSFAPYVVELASESETGNGEIDAPLDASGSEEETAEDASELEVEDVTEEVEAQG